jgi:signal transduction histidine kinase/CheY-like chemotaxis protein
MSFPPLRDNGLTLKIVSLGVAITVLAASGVAFAIWTTGRSTEAEWASRLAAYTTMISAHARQSIGAADLVLRSITDNVQDEPVSDQASLRKQFGTQKAFDMLRAASASVPQIDVAAIVDLNGDVVNLTRSYPPLKINLADRDYFQAHLQDPALEVFLSVPVQNRSDGGWTFYLARKIHSPDGQMIGLVLTGLFSDFFADFYRSVSLGDGQVTSLYRSDGRLLARYPVVRPSLGESFADSGTFTEALGDRTQGVTITNTAQTTNSDSNERRMIAARRDADYPIVVSTNTNRSVYMTEWRRSAWNLSIAGAFICLVLGMTTFLVARLVRELDLARREALTAAEAKSRFVSTISHELRTPLATIIAGASHLVDHDLKAEPLKLAVLVSRSAQHLLLLINDILQFSRGESGKVTVLREPFDVHEVVLNVIEMTRALPSAEGLTLDQLIDTDVPDVVLADRGRVTQVLLNLLSNAVNYTPSGGVLLQVSYRDGSLCFSVRDTGPGISAEDQARIFEPFERAKGASSDVPGTGLGLSISRQLATIMGGRIAVASEVGQGATFFLTIPAPRVEREHKRAEGRRPRQPVGVNILLAEDSSSLRMLMSQQLRKEGFQVTSVANGREAVEAVEKLRPDLVLMDIRMPVMDGFEATHAIRRLPGGAGEVPIFAITAFPNDATVAEAVQAGMVATLTKPLNIAELRVKIAQIMSRDPVVS